MSTDVSLARLRSAIDRAAQLYYAVGEHSASGLTDAEYDSLMDELRRLCPDDPRLTRVGLPYSAEELRNKVGHTIPMGSLDNTDGGIDGFASWYQWLVKECDGGVPSIHVSHKMDGSSVAAYYERGVLQRVVSRGNGEVGEDLTANAVKWRGLPTSLPGEYTIAVRGEAILSKEDFARVNEENKIPPDEVSNPRNVGNGIMGRTDGAQNQYMQFIAFNVIGDEVASLAGKLVMLRSLGFAPVRFDVIQGIGRQIDDVIQEVEALYAGIAEERDDLAFEIDGIVVCANEVGLHDMLTRDRKDSLRPRYARAIKFKSMKNETTVVGVTITVGHTGAIIPTADLEPVRVGGVTVNSALLNNWNQKSDNPTAAHVKIGDVVEVELAGDIIPKICQVVVSPTEAEPIAEPETCPSCGSKTTRVHRGKLGAVTYCSETDLCPAVAVYRLKHYIGSAKKGMGILGIGDSVLQALVAAEKVNSPADLYRLAPETIKDLEIGQNASGKPIRLGESRAADIVREIAKTKRVPLVKFLGALGIDLLGRRRAEILAEQCNLRSLSDWLNPEMLKNISGDTTRLSITEGLKSAKPIIDELLAVGVVVDDFGSPPPAESVLTEVSSEATSTGAAPAGTASSIAGRSFCFTGTRKGVEEVQRLGGIVKSGISRELDFLVQKDPTSSSNKTRKAEGYGTRIISVATLEAVLRGERDLPE